LNISGVIFDLDGTLLDTAPDMVGALNALRIQENLDPLPYPMVRPHVSNGALALLRLAFPDYDEHQISGLHKRYLAIYSEHLSVETAPFPGIDTLLQDLERAGLSWGIVTNKPTALTEPLLAAQGLLHRCACVVSGDTLPQRKPHPAPLLHALQQLGLKPDVAMYIGDAPRDIEAGKAAGMTTVAATYGYIQPDDDPLAWGADIYIDSPAELMGHLAPATGGPNRPG
jgi:phosphoglycolate phosphatase